MKRALIALLSAAVVLSNVQLTVFAQDSKEAIQVMADSQQNAGKLDVVLKMNYRESAETLAKRNLTLTLKNVSNGSSQTLALGGEDSVQDFKIDGVTAKAAVKLHNPEDAPVNGNDKVGFYLVEFTGLPLSSSYHVSFEGEGFRPAEQHGIANNEYVPKVYISAESGGFALGDVNSDKEIDQKDLDKVSGTLGNFDKTADVNLDGVIDITDIALVHHNMGEPRPAEIYEGALVTAGLINPESLKTEMAENGIEITEGNVEDLFSDNGQAVKLENKNPNDKTCVIPIAFSVAREMSEVNIVSPAGTDGALVEGNVLVEYEDGTTETIEYNNAAPEDTHAIERNAGESTVVIKLGKRVPVKKITITVEKIIGEDGKASYAVIEKIEFLKDIIPENIDLEASVPKNVYAEPGDKSASLTWKKVDNVDGYIVKYGTSASALTLQLKVGSNEALVEGLENLKTYYFTVSAYSGDWTGDPSAAVTCIPQPTKVPRQPDMVSLSPEDKAIVISWKKTEDAEFYNVYYKETEAGEFQLATEQPVTGTSLNVSGLTNDVSYDFYVVAGNKIGFGPKSLTATGAPVADVLKIPTLPTMNRIPNSDIISVSMDDPGNVSSEYEGKFDIKWVYDNDFETHWSGASWWRSSRFTFVFNEEKSMDYLIYVPRLNKGYPESFSKYSVSVKDKDGNVTHLTSDEGKLGNNNAGDVAAPTVRNNPKETGYAILPFERNDHIKELTVMVRQWNGAPKPSGSLAEIAFYTYDDIDDSIAALFTDNTYTAVSSSATQAKIDELRARLDSSDGYYVNKEILADELDLAEALMKGDNSKLGAVMDSVQSHDASSDKKRINTFQPLGVVAEAGKQIVVYAEIPEGENISIIPTQHFAEASRWIGSSIKLENGRNIIDISKINDVSPQRGGSLYLQYSGLRADEIKLQIRGAGATKIPMLELSDWHEISESEVKARISDYVSELNSYYTAKLSGMNNNTLGTHFLNATEIAFPHVLLSIPASQVRSALGSDGVQTIYNDGLAWEELMQIMYCTHGIDLEDLEASQSRHNIRYMRMFGNAFMYASGNHIGIGYGSCSGMLAGRPTSVTGLNNANGLFGWGIHHEIGHVMDSLGKAEITNNIYALFGQTHDGGQNALTSRLEASNKYEKIFDKVTSGQKGMANDVFVSLGMYWQLHLAYDGANDNFYNEVNKVLSGGGDDAFMAAASEVSGYDLSEFFESWGFEPSGQSGSPEERKLQYLTDESRRERLKGTTKQSGSVGISASYNKEERIATVTISPVSGAKMMGYEISRELNGITEPVAFLSVKSGETTWTDTLGSINNKAVRYSVKAVDILGYVIDEASSGQVDVSHDNIIDKNDYSWDTSKLSDGILTATFDGSLSVAGIKFNEFAADGQPAEVVEPSTEPSDKQETPSDTEKKEENPVETPEKDSSNNKGPGETTDPAEPDQSNEPDEPGETTEPGDSSTEPNEPAEPEGESTPDTPDPDAATDTEGKDSSTNEEEPSTDTESNNTESSSESGNEGISTQSNEGTPADGQDADPTEPNPSEPSEGDSSNQEGQDSTSSNPADEDTGSSQTTSGDVSDSTDTDNTDKGDSSDTDNSNVSDSTPDDNSSSSSSSSSSEAPEGGSSEGTSSSSSSSSSAALDSSSSSSSSTPENPANQEQNNSNQKADTTGKVVTVEVSTDNTNFTTVLEISYEELSANPDKLRFFTRKDADGSICPFDAKTIRISGLPSSVSAEKIDFAAYPGDYIEFGVNGIGIMGRDYGDIKAGTLVVTGNFRGNPVFNTVRVYGRSQSGDMVSGDLTESDKVPMAGEIYLFAALPETGDMAEIDNGLWIFVPSQQDDETLADPSDTSEGCASSLLPTQIMAELHRKDVPEGGSGRITSYTRWIPSPTYESMPQIILED